jgi:hypothetical protein
MLVICPICIFFPASASSLITSFQTYAEFLSLCIFSKTASVVWSDFLATNSRRYQIFGEVVHLERGPLRLVSTIEELLERKSSVSCLENRVYGRRDPPH